MFCSSANWVSGTGRTGQSGPGLAVSWGSRWEDRAASGKGERIRLPSCPSPASGRGTPLPGTHPAPRAPRASRVSRNLLVAQDSIGEAPAKDWMEGVTASKSLDPPVHPRPGILQPPHQVKQQRVLLLFLFFFKRQFPPFHPPASPQRRVWLIWFPPKN